MGSSFSPAVCFVDKVRTLSDTKRKFYAHHTRPINSVYRRVVEELMVEMHLLSVNVDFRYDPIYALGVVTSFDRFMTGYQPERDKESIFAALCYAVDGDPQKYRQDAENLKKLPADKSGQELLAWFKSPEPVDGAGDIEKTVSEIADNPKFKYSRLFAIGLYTLLEQVEPELLQEEEKRKQTLQQLCESLGISLEKIQKDLELYRGNLEKMEQAQSTFEDLLRADRKQRERRSEVNKEDKKPEQEGTSDTSATEDDSSTSETE